MFEFLQQIGQKVAEFFAPQPFNPSRRGLMGIGAATAAQAAVTGGITSTAMATASGPNLNEHLEILKVIDELGRLKWDHGFRLEYPTPKLNDWITTEGEKDYVEKVKESATAYQAKYQAALQKLEELSSKGFSISMEEIRKPLVAANRWERKSLADQFRNLHFPKGCCPNPRIFAKPFSIRFAT